MAREIPVFSEHSVVQYNECDYFPVMCALSSTVPTRGCIHAVGESRAILELWHEEKSV